MCEVILGYKNPFVITRYVFGLSFLAVFGLSLFHFGAPGVSRKTLVFLRLEWKVSRVNTTQHKGNSNLEGICPQRGKGENFTGNFNDM